MNRCLVGLGFASSAFVGAAQVPATVIAAGYSASTPIKVAPGQVLTVFVHGIGSKLSAPVNADTVPLPTSLAGISAKLVQFNPEQAVPILAVEPIVTCSDALKQFGPGCGSYTAVTLQIPFEMQAEDPTRLRGAPVGGAVLRFSEDGEIAATVGLVPIVDQVHLLRSCDVILSKLAGTGAGDFACKPIAAHADGELVGELNPAQAGEEIVLYGVGFGQTSPQMATGHPASPPERSCLAPLHASGRDEARRCSGVCRVNGRLCGALSTQCRGPRTATGRSSLHRRSRRSHRFKYDDQHRRAWIV